MSGFDDVLWRESARIEKFVEWDIITPRQAPLALDRLRNDVDALGNLIQPGMKFWNNDLKVVEILPDFTIEPDWRQDCGIAIWWRTTGGLFDGSRLALKHPSTKEIAG